METDFVSLRQMDVAEGVRGGGGGVLGSRDPVGRPPLKNVPGMSPWVPFKQEELIKADAKVRNAVDSKDGNWPESDASRNVR